MALPVPELDDRKFQDIVDEAKRLIPRYCPEWTNHNLSDPGVALIELFAWMSEMVLFRVNQVPDRLYLKFLELVGIEAFPPAVAETDITFLLSTVLDHDVVVPAGTEVSTVAGTGTTDVVFATREDLVISPPEVIGCLTGRSGADERYTDAWNDLRYESSVLTCFTSSPIKPGDAVYFGFDRSLAGNLIRLEVTANIEGIGVDPASPPLRWEVWSGEAWIAAHVHLDTTGGLNRDGEVRLLIPMAHDGVTLGSTRAHWIRAVFTNPRPDQPTYQASPQLRSVVASSLGGTVAAEHAEQLQHEQLGRSDGSDGQRFNVRRAPVLPRREGEHVVVITADGVETWIEVDDFTSSDADDRHVHWDNATGVVSFGPRVRYPDGSVRQHGAIPADGATIAVTGYRHGGGAAGNVGTGTLTALRSTLPYIDSVSNLAPATGGVDPETVENAKIRGPLTLRHGQRAVTSGDYERLTLESSVEVARARCLPPIETGGPVRVLVVPHVRTAPTEQVLDDFALDDAIVARIAEHLDERRVVGTPVEIGTPYYQGVTVAALVRALPGRPPELLRQRSLDLLYGFINPLVGGPEGQGWPWDTDLNAATLAQMLEAVDGVDRVEEVLLFEYDLRTDQRSGVGREVIRLDDRSVFLSARHQIVVR